MPDLFSAESADSTSESASPQLGSASTTNTAEPSSNATGPESPSTPTCGSLEPTPLGSMCSTAATPVSRSATPDYDKERTIPAISGLSSPDSFAYYDPGSSSLKTCQATLDLDSTESSLTLPAWGWMSGGELYERPMSGRLTNGPVSSSLLPTPSSEESTPTDEFVEEMLASGIQPHERLYMPGRKWHSQRTLSRIAPTLLPTPTGDGDDANNVTRESGDFQSLARTAHQLLPTPTTQDGANNAGPSQRERNSDPLNVVAAKASTGESTKPPSDSGKASQEPPHPDQLTIEVG